MDEPVEPIRREDLDNQLVKVIRAYRMAQRLAHWILAFVAVIAIVSLVVSLTTYQGQISTAQHAVTKVVSAQCAFYRDLGTVPPPEKVTEFGIKILVDSRNAYIGLGCIQKLPAPSPALVSGAAKHGITLRG